MEVQECVCVCVYTVHWLKASALKSVCLAFMVLFLFHILQHFVNALEENRGRFNAG